LGLDISNKRVVSLNNTHDRLVVTDPLKNPVEYDIIPCKLTAIYQRKKAKSRSGDGNPLIYALKNMHKFSISNADKNTLCINMKEIVVKHYENTNFDSIVVIPSSKPIAEWVGVSCREALNIPSLDNNVFIKVTNAGVLNQLKKIEGETEIIELRKRLETEKPNGIFKVKDLSQHQRSFVIPIIINPFFKNKYKNILLIDDLVSSGTTLKAGYDAFKGKYPDVEISCLSLLGPVT